MNIWVLGIDPGVSGALSVIKPNGEIAYLAKPPTVQVLVNKSLRRKLNLPIFAATVRELQESSSKEDARLVAYVEEVSSMPTDGGIQGFAFGRNFGQIEGILAALDVPYTLVRPKEWKAYMVAKQVSLPKLSKTEGGKFNRKQKDRLGRAVAKARKVASVEAATRLFPRHAEVFSKPEGDGAAEASLLAEWGRRRESSSTMEKPKQEKITVDPSLVLGLTEAVSDSE
jgi:crossover junction endodeoxyribonuclease RuvC